MDSLNMHLAVQVRQTEIANSLARFEKRGQLDELPAAKRVSTRWGWLTSLIAAF